MNRIFLSLAILIIACSGSKEVSIGTEMDAVREYLGFPSSILQVSRDNETVFVHFYEDNQTSYVFGENAKTVCGIYHNQKEAWPLNCAN